jgi:hypothetical protein
MGQLTGEEAALHRNQSASKAPCQRYQMENDPGCLAPGNCVTKANQSRMRFRVFPLFGGFVTPKAPASWLTG